jgi:hypothetical protein
VGAVSKTAPAKAPVAVADDEDEDDVKKFFAGVLDDED